MIVLFVASCIALLFTYLGSKEKYPFGLEMAFCIVTFLAAIHYNYGNDYSAYSIIFDTVVNVDYDWRHIFDGRAYKEYGWAILCLCFKPLGFLWMVAFLSAFQNIVYYKFIQKYVPKNLWVLGMFVYLFTTSLYVLNMSMMRQGLTICMFVLAWMCLSCRTIPKILLALGIVYIATTIHDSAIILYPCLLFVFFTKKTKKVYCIVVIFLFALFFLKPDMANDVISYFSSTQGVERLFEKYVGTSEDLSYGIGFAMILLPMVLSCYTLFKNDDLTDIEYQIIAISLLGFVILPFREVIPILCRVGYYFNAFSIAAIPIVYKQLNGVWLYIFLSLFILVTLLMYWSFFHSPIYIDDYMNFRSVFEVLF